MINHKLLVNLLNASTFFEIFSKLTHEINNRSNLKKKNIRDDMN